MKRIYVLVEGQTEREFVTRLLAPYFGQFGIRISPVPMSKSGGGMGFSNLEHFKNNIKPLLFEKDPPLVTTFVDLFRFPVQSGLPEEEIKLKEYTANPNIEERIAGFEDVLNQAVQRINSYSYFIPYIQKHEFEALLFADADAFGIVHEGIQRAVEDVLNEIPEPEEINTTEMGHPAKRLTEIYLKNNQKYIKSAEAVDIAEVIGLKVILDKCPRFRKWIETLVTEAQK